MKFKIIVSRAHFPGAPFFLLLLYLLAGFAPGAEVAATFDSATTVPVTAAGYTATGNTLNLALNFAPPTGTSLTVVNNTGVAVIQGKFGNLTQGQTVNLMYGGISYPFVASYFGGTGNDLVLRWGNTRLLAWGDNTDGQLGRGNLDNSNVPVAADMSGVLFGPTVTAVAVGRKTSYALSADGRVAAWGNNDNGQLGINDFRPSSVPVAVDHGGALFGRQVQTLTSKVTHVIALCTDGAVVAWGANDNGQASGNASSENPVPTTLASRGVLADRPLVALAAGSYQSLALAADGTLGGWGGGSSWNFSKVPVLLDSMGVLAGKTITAVASGWEHGLALCSDGTLAAWGSNGRGQLGDGTTTARLAPVAVNRSGVLSGKTIIALAAGGEFSLVLCSDGTLASWGHGQYSQLGNGSTSQSALPVLVRRTGVLAGKTVARISAGDYHSLALCSDGTLAAWGLNEPWGTLGNGSLTNSSVPVLVNANALRSGERFMTVVAGGTHNLALVASPPPAVATTLEVAGITDTGAILRGNVNANGVNTSVSFQYGLTASYGTTVTAAPATLTGTTATAISTTLSGLVTGTTYHYRVVATSAGGTIYGENQTFTTRKVASLGSLSLEKGVLLPAFSPVVVTYAASVPNTAATITVTPVAENATSTITVNGVAVASGSPSAPLNLNVGNNTISVVVTPLGASFTKAYTVTVTRLPAVASFSSAAVVPVTTAGFRASGQTIHLELGFAPPAGTSLTLVRNTGSEPIEGVFANLAQGQRVNLSFGDITYLFVADYFGGSGNDLVLQWGNTRVVGWGNNQYGSLGDNTTTDSPLPVAVEMTGVLTGKTVTRVASGGYFSVALCSDGTLAAWGSGSGGQLGNSLRRDSSVPVLVDRSGVLAGKTVIAIAVGDEHSLVLCSDGTLASWGRSPYGALGSNDSMSLAPVLVTRTGVLAGKSVTAIAAGGMHSMALCADGTVATWGYNWYGALGNNTNNDSSVPVLVDTTGVLAGKTVTAIAAGGNHSLALCSDGTVAGWGRNSDSELGNNSTTNSKEPVLVNRTGVLAGRTVTAIAGGNNHSLALCSDGRVVGWGWNDTGALGNNTTTASSVPVLVVNTGALSGKTVSAIAAGNIHSLALCADGTVATWGYNRYGALGNNSNTDSSVPVLVSTNAQRAGERFAAGTTGKYHDLALVASPPPPLSATTLAATGIVDASAMLNGTANANGTSATVSFEYGLTTAYGNSITATPATINGTLTTAVSAMPSGLLAGATYHYRVITTSPFGTLKGEDMTFTTTTFATLSNLGLSQGALSPEFSSTTIQYLATVPHAVSSITVTPVCEYATANVTVNGVTTASGAASEPINLAVGGNVISTVVTAAGGGNSIAYQITVIRLPQALTYNSPADVPVTASEFVAAGNTAGFVLNYTPLPGTVLTVVNNTGNKPLQGTFDNLAHGQRVLLAYGGVNYPFVANYYGGTGNDLVLHWANARLMSWGANESGQLGNATATNGLVPAPVQANGVLEGKTVMATAAGFYHSLALCTDGTLTAWGGNDYGQLGSSASSNFPFLVNQTGALAGKNVIAIAAGGRNSLALCADGVLAAWGYNSNGQLGNGTTSTSGSSQPVLVDRTGVLAGKTVVAIAVGDSHSLALCADGSLASWGLNTYGQLGIGTGITASSMPALVNLTGVLAGKTVKAITAGARFSVVLCTDGTLAAWGYGSVGELGNGQSGITSAAPVLVTRTGVLVGKTATAISAGSYHCLVLCSDGTLAAWGAGGQLGNNSTASSSVPVLVNRSGVLLGKTVTAICAGNDHSSALCTDGTLVAWGGNSKGQLGRNDTTASSVPVAVNTAALRPGERVTAGISAASHNLAIIASPPTPLTTTLAAAGVTDTGATLNGSISDNGTTTTVSFEYGLTTSYGSTLAATPATLAGATTTAVSAAVTGLLAESTYHYRVVATNLGGTTVGEDQTFTTSSFASLASLQLNLGTLMPDFSGSQLDYAVAVPSTTESVSITPVAKSATATVTVNGAAVASGATSGPLALAVGNNAIQIRVAAADGINTRTYAITVTRLPEAFVFNSAAGAPVTVSDFPATGNTAAFALRFTPAVGTDLTVINNTGPNPIQGTFNNLSQGQRVQLTMDGLTYPFIANYFGGTGNDLVLQWANTRLLAWGPNGSGQLGNGTTVNSLIPTPADLTGSLADKTITSAATGSGHSLALCADGTIGAWGGNSGGVLGNGGGANSAVPVLVNRAGVLSGKVVIATAAGYSHSLALCADGTLVAWGNNFYGELGNGNTNFNSVPVAVNQTGVLANKKIVGIAAGSYFSLALCADGTMATWGCNDSGRLGNNSTAHSSVPVAVNTAGVLAGKKAVAIAAGIFHGLALCADGSLVAWGDNNYGQLGNKSTVTSSVPVLVDRAGALAGKTVTAITAGSYHSLVLGSDGTLATWGSGGQLGNGGSSNSSSPVLVTTSGVLAGKTAVAVAGGSSHSLALCSDGTLAAWGTNFAGQLGNNSTSGGAVPVLVNQTAMRPGERLEAVVAGSSGSNSLALVAMPLAPAGTTLAASGINDAGATLNAVVNAQGANATVSFEYGLTDAYGATVTAVPAAITGTSPTVVSANLGGLLPGTTYHYRLRVDGLFGTALGESQTFTTSTRAILTSVEMSAGSISPSFQGALTDYGGTVPSAIDRIRISPIAATGSPMITINGTLVSSGTQSPEIMMEHGLNTIHIHVDAGDGLNVKTYTLTLRRLPQSLLFNVPEAAPLTVNELTATGDLSPVSLGFQPLTGGSLILIDVSGDKLIRGEFANLPHGGSLLLNYGDITYHFVADYAGGDGNDLVLQWANRRLLAWGSNRRGQLGDGTNTASLVPTSVNAAGVLAGATVTRISAGMTSFSEFGFSHAVTQDGRVASWGYGDLGTLGNGGLQDATVPVWVDHDGVLAGRKVIDIGNGAGHTVALCLDGGMVAWGYNSYSSQLGDGTTTNRAAPVNIPMTGALAGKRVRAIAVGNYHNLALCEDGTLIGWGDNTVGELGTGDTVRRRVPVIIPMTGALEGRRIVRIAAGASFSLALCDDGTLATWGYNAQGQLGNGSTVNSSLPVAVNRSGALLGKNVVKIACGYNHALAHCDDGSLAAWGNNGWGQLGIGQPNSSGFSSVNSLPVLVNMTGINGEKTATAVSGSRLGTLARLSDGRFLAWGINGSGQLGDGSKIDRSLPVEVSRQPFHSGEIGLATGSSCSAGSHALGLTALALPDAMVQTAADITGVSATLQGIVIAKGNEVIVAFEYGLDSSLGSRVDATSGGEGGANVFAELSGLKPGTPYFYRIVVEGYGGIVRSPVTTFTTLSDNAKLAALSTSAGAPAPVFEKEEFRYFISVANTTDQVSITPTTDHPGAKVQIEGQTVVSGSASQPLPLAVGNNTLTVSVTGEDRITTLTYTLVITRLAAILALDASGVPSITADGFFVNDQQAMLRLDFHPSSGSTLMVVNNTSLAFIFGRFSNLAHGQRVWLTYGGVSYPFVANYHGGTGNDLVLQWAGTRVAAWGLNNYGQLGDGGNTQRLAPVAVDDTGVLADKTIFALATGYLHSVALCSDGTLASWGYNVQGQLGDNGSANQSGPVAVDRSGVLAGKVVVAIASGSYHNLALCSDGSIAAWGFNNHGQLGDGTNTTARTPVRVKTDGVLAGKQVVAVAAGAYQSYALCSDGTIAAWGYNDEGELGNGGSSGTPIPVAVALSDRKAVSIAAGQYHALALCTDGTLLAWGYNPRGQLGNSSIADSKSPVPIGAFGALAGKSVKTISAGASHSLALCDDGTLAAWGLNSQNQLGVTGIPQSTTPVTVIAPARPLAALAAGAHHNLLRFADGGMAAWGGNSNGQLGSNQTQPSPVAVGVDTRALDHGGFIMFAASGCASSHNLAVFAAPVTEPTGLEAWRSENFNDVGTTHPLAADGADCDGDGIPNLVEYAFRLDPRADCGGKPPQPERVGNRLELRFSRAQVAPDIEFRVEWSPDLQPGSWLDVPDSGTDDEHVFSMSSKNVPSMFMRHRLRSKTPP